MNAEDSKRYAGLVLRAEAAERRAEELEEAMSHLQARIEAAEEERNAAEAECGRLRKAISGVRAELRDQYSLSTTWVYDRLALILTPLEALEAENTRLRATLDGDPDQTANPELRRAWRLSAVRYADKLEAECRRLRAKLKEYEDFTAPIRQVYEPGSNTTQQVALAPSGALEAENRRPREANILKTVSSEWEHTDNPGEVPCHSRMIEGVLCRWWGRDEPPGVAMIDRAALTPPEAQGREEGKP